MRKLAGCLFLLMVLGLPSRAAAVSLIGQDPPVSLLVSAGGLEWVYAAPCAPIVPSCGVVSLHHGFFIPSAADWNASFADLNALIAAFGIPNANGFTGAPCAAAYFSTLHDHCDGNDAIQGYVWGAPFAPDAFHRENAAAEAFLVRRAVPEPASLALLGAGLAGLAAKVRRRRKN